MKENEVVLNKRQKEFLFKNGYVTAKTLDAAVYKGWEDYFINRFAWVLDKNLNRYHFNELVLRNTSDGFVYKISLNFQDDDLETLLNLKPYDENVIYKTIALFQRFGNDDYAIVNVSLTPELEVKLAEFLEEHNCCEGSTRGSLEEVLAELKEDCKNLDKEN